MQLRTERKKTKMDERNEKLKEGDIVCQRKQLIENRRKENIGRKEKNE